MTDQAKLSRQSADILTVVWHRPTIAVWKGLCQYHLSPQTQWLKTCLNYSRVNKTTLTPHCVNVFSQLKKKLIKNISVDWDWKMLGVQNICKIRNHSSFCMGAVWGMREAGWKHGWRTTSQRLLQHNFYLYTNQPGNSVCIGKDTSKQNI